MRKLLAQVIVIFSVLTSHLPISARHDKRSKEDDPNIDVLKVGDPGAVAGCGVAWKVVDVGVPRDQREE